MFYVASVWFILHKSNHPLIVVLIIFLFLEKDFIAVKLAKDESFKGHAENNKRSEKNAWTIITVKKDICVWKRIMGMNDSISYVLVIFKYKGILTSYLLSILKNIPYIASHLSLQIILQKRKRQSLWKDCSLS